MTDRQVSGHEGLYVLAPEGSPAGLADRVGAWAQVLPFARVATPGASGHPTAVAVLDLRATDEPARPG